MINETYLKVRYAETDQMGVVYYANYFVWMEVGRTDLIRKIGITYREIEDRGYLLPVVYTSAKFIDSSYYDDDIVVQSCLIEITKTKLSIGYKIFRIENYQKSLVCVGLSELVFLDKNTRKVVKVPDFFAKVVKIEKNESYDEFVETIRKHLKFDL
ncbi:MAG: acyl-CoA thioesterase [Brevinematales bacterium]|nr:acyl-CoA thioesterase [Brevinematales bacterium]